MGISSNLGAELQGLFNQWSRARITDKELKKLLQVAMAPNKEVLKNLETGKMDNFQRPIPILLIKFMNML